MSRITRGALILFLLISVIIAGCTPQAEPAAEVADSDTSAADTADAAEAEEVEEITEAEESEEVAEAEEAAEDASAGDDMYGGTLIAGLVLEPSTVDPPAYSSNADTIIGNHIFNSLVEPDLQMVSQGALATSWELEGDNTWVFHLREGVTFHNGEVFDADSVEFSLDYYLNHDSEFFKGFINMIETVEVVDDYTVKFVLEAPRSVFPDQLANIRMLPVGFDPTNPIGTGPYRFVEWKRNEAVKVERNDNYWKEGLPYLDGVTFRPILDPQARVIQLTTGEVHWLEEVVPSSAAELEANPDVNIYKLADELNSSVYYMWTNFEAETSPFFDRDVRHAVAYALDREAVAGLTFGYGWLHDNPFPAGHPMYNLASTTYSYDPAKAKELLAKAGYTEPVEITMLVTQKEEFVLPAQALQAGMNEAGFDVTLEIVDFGEWVEKVFVNREHDIAIQSFFARGWDPISVLNASYYFYDFVNPEYGEIMAQAVAENDPAKQKDLYFQLSEIGMTEMPGIVIGGYPLLVAARAEVMGYELGGTTQIPLDNVWLSE
jgi:peptide/nickel transport system substrate-binding protein